MNNKLIIIIFSFFFMLVHYLNGQRKQYIINDNWRFTPEYIVAKNSFTEINLPHTWNTKDALGGNPDYYRGIGNYERDLELREEWKGKRFFIRFLGANQIANVFVNGKHVGEHRGGYTAFAFEITDFVSFKNVNKILVRVSNAPQLDVMPLLGDFNFYGGLYRDVELYVMEQSHISLMDYGSKGVYLHQLEVTEKLGKVEALIKLLNDEKGSVSIKVKDEDGKLVLSKTKPIKKHLSEVVIPFEITNPMLWNGKENPYLYSVVVTLNSQSGEELDRVIQPLGLRYFHIDPENGFYLNGNYLKIRGVNRHQDRPEIGNALADFHHIEDVRIMEEIGANGLRMSHYPHAPIMYDLMDKKGFVVYSEIPFVGPGGYRGKGFVDQPSFKENGRQQLIEMIRQNINHPSVMFWGIYNELTVEGDDPFDYVKELNSLAKKEDPSRLTIAATMLFDKEINRVAEVIAYNRYQGWYGNTTAHRLGTWADGVHAKWPDKPIGLSEYGAGASIKHQQDTLVRTVPNSYWHPENWQTNYHEIAWQEIDKRKFIWGSFVWNLFDFGAAHRTEGEVPGKNDKGLVTFDRKDRKDAFYFYKANWNKEEPTLYITERRLMKRTGPKQTIKVYTNQDEIFLSVNGGDRISSRPDDYARCYFDVELKPGTNTIIATNGNNLKDEINVILQ